MTLYMDIHREVEGLTEEAVAGAHARDLEVQEKYGADLPSVESGTRVGDRVIYFGRLLKD